MSIPAIIYQVILLLGLLTGVAKYKSLESVGKLIFFFLVYINIKEAIALLLAQRTNYNLHFYQIAAPIDFLFLMFIYCNLHESKRLRWTIVSIALVVITFFIINLTSLQPLGKTVDTYFKLVRSFFLVLISLMVFQNILQRRDGLRLKDSSTFWFNTGVLIFFSTSIFYWGLYNYSLTLKGFAIPGIIRRLYEFSNYCMYLMFIVALLKSSLPMHGTIRKLHASDR
ncbi:MAG TPA: hypothetical protein VD996_11940 [Chitinophagaceae bacterium]|nr:hypothetical protein [Chitinophagaceae bacterium]